MNSLFEEALIILIVLHCTDSCPISSQVLHEMYSNENPCLDVNEGITQVHYPYVILHPTNVSNITHLVMKNKGITHIDLNAFKGLVHLSLINLEYNNIYFLKAEMFIDLKALEKLILKKNQLSTLNNGTFKHLCALQELDLSYNCIKQLNKDSFLGLVSLKTLSLVTNLLLKLENEVFKHLVSLQEVQLQGNSIEAVETLSAWNLTDINLEGNKLKNIKVNSFAGMKFLKYLDLAYNILTECTLSYIRSLEKLNLFDNDLTHINKVMFAGLINLRVIRLIENMIEAIDKGAFKDLRNLEELFLSRNKLTVLWDETFQGLVRLNSLDLSSNYLNVISKKMFKGLVSLNSLELDKNKIVLIEEYAFADITSGDKKTTINLLDNAISELSWTIFGNSSEKISTNRITLKINTLVLKCKRSHCWFKHLEWKIFDFRTSNNDLFNNFLNAQNTAESSNINTPTTQFPIVELFLNHHNPPDLSNINSLIEICDKTSKLFCPSKAKWCMYPENNTCEDQCVSSGKAGGQLVIDGDVCPFQYYCKCTCSPCNQQCALQGKIHVTKDKDIYDCDVCNCQCDNNPNCWQKCSGDNFRVKNGTSGCPECNCKCPSVDCNAKCEGRGMGIIRMNKVGCQVCDGCKIKASKGESNTLTYVLISLVVSITVVLLLAICGICLCRRGKGHGKQMQPMEEDRFTILDVFTKNLDPLLVQQVKESWFDPKTLCVKQLLGNGQFGLVWSGVFEASQGRKYPAAIKVAKAEYKDVWTVQTNWNDKHELKPHFEKRPVQVQLENQKIEDFLMEAFIMKKFHHPNILKILGLSACEGKPCIILPLMCHGDLKKYLIQNKYDVMNQQLTSFALGVAKGMAHLAEKNFVHCDLAARNCLLDVDLVVKIADFGMTKFLSYMEYYQLEDTEKPLPIRWMSIESLQFKKFTLESDVWSFGVVLWEIFSCGQLPYTKMENMDVLKCLLDGYRLKKPKSCSENMFEIMQTCWYANPSERPGFDGVVSMINKIADKEGDYTEVKDESKYT